jgi:hypothetical protein
MRIYISSMSVEVLKKYKELFPDTKINVLRSFGVLDSDVATLCKRFRPQIGGLILDSGTWTLNQASSAATYITVEKYIAYLLVAAKYFDFYFNFDSNFDADGFEENYGNQLKIEERGLNPVPVVHDIDGEEIQRYIDRNYSRVALGSRQIRTLATLEEVMSQFEGTGIKIHLFGQTKYDFLANVPVHSCDTAMWAREGAWGNIRYWNPQKEKENKTDHIYMEERILIDKTEGITFSKYEQRKEFEEYLWNTFKLEYYDLIGGKGALNKRLVNTHYFMQLEKIITDIHKKKGFKTDE